MVQDGLLDRYVDKDVVMHFASLLQDKNLNPVEIAVFGDEIWNVISQYNLTHLLPASLKLTHIENYGIPQETPTFIEKLIYFAGQEKFIITLKKDYFDNPKIQPALIKLQEHGADIRIVDDILGAMVVASRKRRNKVIFPIAGYEDEALITAAGLAKSKTVGFRNFFVLNGHLSLAGIVNHLAKENNQLAGFIVPLKVGLNTGAGQFSNVALTYNKGVVFSGYEPMEIMQSIWMAVSNEPAVRFQRTKEVSDEVINRSRWMLDEVFEPTPLELDKQKIIDNGSLQIKEKYQDFDAKHVKTK